MTDRPTDIQLASWRAFLEAHAAVTRSLERELTAETGLPLAWYDVLVQLAHRPERRLRMTDLANAVLLSRSGLTRLVSRMEEEGLVRREPCPSDARGSFTVLTDCGYERLRAAAPVHLRGVGEHFTGLLSDEEIDVLAAALGRVRDANHGSVTVARG